MSHLGFSEIQKPPRDSLELASLASSDPDIGRASESSSRSGITSSRRLSLENEDPLDSANPASRPGRIRSYSVSSAFDFTPALFPLTSTTGGYAPLGAPSTPGAEQHQGILDGGNLEKHKTLTYLNGLSLVIGLIIGSGIFSSPSQVNSHAGSPGASLIVWAVAGVLAWTGAASYAELGGAIPLNGGAQIYLSKIFGEMMGFLFTWTSILVLKPGSAAIIAVIFGEYVVRAAIGAEVEDVNPWINKGPALGALIIVTLLNCISTRLAARVGDLFMFFKIIALVAVTVIGVIVAATGFSYRGPANTDWKTHSWFAGTSTDISNWAVALYAGLWAFDGWDNTNYVTGEFKNPTRDLPRVIHTAMPVVILAYIMANVAYFFVLPVATIEKSNTVAVQFGSKVFGPVGALVLALTVGASCFGALNASTFTSGRLVYVAGRESYIPAFFGNIGIGKPDIPSVNRFTKRSSVSKFLSRWLGDAGGVGFGYTPINGLVLYAIITAIYIMLGEFKTLITFYGVAGYTFYFTTVLGLIVLRIREPNLERPYRTWITTPIIFCCVSLFLVSRAVIAQPVQTMIVVAFIISGIPVYFWRISKRDGPWKGRGGGDMRFWKRWGGYNLCPQQISKCHTIFLSFETLQKDSGVDTFVECHDKDSQQILRDVATAIGRIPGSRQSPPRILVIIDALTTLAVLSTQSPSALNLPAYLSSLLVPSKASPHAQISLVVVNHVDVPLPPSSPRYSPTPLALVSYLATTIITLHSLPQVLAEKAARERSLPAPLFGLNEEVDGVVLGLTVRFQRLKHKGEGVVIELEHRRKSGRGVHETYFLPRRERAVPPSAKGFTESIILLDDHPLYQKDQGDQRTDDELAGLTFELGLTDRQKQEREGVVLPYFDAQQAGGGGEGGRILYDMGIEDDFDEEEDEI